MGSQEDTPIDSSSISPASANQSPSEPEVAILHNTEDTVRGILKPRDEVVRELGWNGDLVATITLPAPGRRVPNPTGDDTDKKIGIIDFGESSEGEKVILVFPSGKKLVDASGNARLRYALVPLNYSPKTNNLYYPLAEGETMLGRNDTYQNYILGLVDEAGDNEAISREHVTITLDPQGLVHVRDHSMNGTGFETG